MKQILRFRGCHCPKGKRYLYLIIYTKIFLTSAGYHTAHAQQPERFTVSGKVISAASGVAIEGATVTNKRTRIHAATDRLGEYRIPARPDDILVYSFVGYVNAEEKVGGREQIIVALDSAENTLEEVEINAGYYTTTRRTSTGNIAKVTAEEIEKQPVLNVMEALKGRMAGVNIQTVSGGIGGAFSIQVRGQNSLRTAGNDPLFLIDGVPFMSTPLKQVGNTLISGNPLNTLNPSDILKIEVLKDADATAIYGSRGSNGVILISTKSGQSGRSRLVADVSAGTGRIGKFTKLLNTDQFLEMRREAFANNPNEPLTVSVAPDLLLYDSTRYTDWQNELLGGTARNLSTKLSLSGGKEGLNYLMSGSYLTQGNVYPGDFTYQRGSGHLSLRQGKGGDRFQAHIALTYTVDNNNLPEASTNLVLSALTLAPNAPSMLTPEGLLNNPDGSFTNNPMSAFMQPYTHRSANSAAQASVSYHFLDGLYLKSTFGYSMLRSEETQLSPASSSPWPQFAVSNVQQTENTSTTWNVEPQLNWDLKIKDGFSQVLIGATVQQNNVDGSNVAGYGFINEQLMNNITQAQTVYLLAPRYSQYRYLAGFGRVNYSHADKYLLNITARRDGSSRFGPGKQWGNFGALGAAWVFSEEDWMKERISWLGFGKFRASYGVTGSDQIPDYGYMSTYTVNSVATNTAGVYPIIANPSRLANLDYHWESTRKLEAALEFGILGERLHGTLAWYSNRSGNQLVGYALPGTSGFTSVQANLPAVVQNRGFELDFQSINLKMSNFEWNSGINLTFPSRRLLKYPNIEASSYNNTYQVGESMDRNRVFLYNGVNPETGVYEFEDVDANGIIEDNDRIWRDQYAIFYGGIANRFSFKRLEFSFFIQLDNRERAFVQSYELPGASAYNQPAEVLDRWQKPGDIAPFQKFWPGYSGDAYVQFYNLNGSSNAWLENCFFVRLSNVSLDFNVPAYLFRSSGIQGLRLSVHGQNLWVSDKRNRFDPETNYNQLPPLRMLTGSIQLTL